MPNDITTTSAGIPEKVAPPPKPETPAVDYAALLNDGGSMHYRTEQYRFDFRLDKETKTRRPSFWLALPVITWDGLMARAQLPGTEGDKYKNYILDLIGNEVFNAAKQQVGDEEKPVNSQEELNAEALTFDALVNQPPSVRRGNGIAKELWEDFAKDYLAVMPEATGKSVERIGNQVKLLAGKFAACKTQKKVIAKLLEELEIYAAGTTELETFMPIVEFLMKKGNDLVNMSEEDMLANL
jgi:hypothetical protein